MKTKKNILVFVAVSLLLHAALFITIAPQDIVLPANTGNTISLSISVNKSADIKPVQQPSLEKPVVSKATPAKQQDKKTTAKKQQLAEKAKSTKQPKPLLASQTPQKTASTLSQTRIISLLKDKFQQHFYYPKMAQRQNWQGKVLLVFDINTHGRIQNITVQQSSGYSILDNAAMTSLTKVSTIPKNWIKSEYYSGLKLTVKYRLEES